MRNFVVIIDWVEEFEVKLEDSSTLFQTDKTQERNLQIKLCRFQNDAEFLHVVLEKKIYLCKIKPACTQMDENDTEDVNFASIINKFQVYDIAS